MASILKESKFLARHSSVYAIGIFVQRATALFLLPLYTSKLTPTDYGINEMVGLSVDIIGILLATAISSAIYRFYFEFEEESQRNLVISTAFLALGGAGLVLLLALAPLTPLLARTLLDDAGLARFFLIAFGSLLFQVMNKVSLAWLRAKQMSGKFVAVSLLRFGLTVGLNIWFIAGLGLGVLGILLSTLIASIAVFLLLSVPLLLKIGIRFDRGLLKEILRFGWPMIISQFGGFVVHLSDRVFLKHYAGLAETGIYSLGYRFGTLPSQFTSEPFNQAWMPRRFEVAKQPDSEHVFGRIFTYYLLLVFWAGLVVAGITADVLKAIADPRYWSAAAVVPVVVLANIIFTFHYHFNIGIMLEKKTKYLGYINTITAVSVLLLNWLLIPRYFAMGAAIATLITFILKAGLTFAAGRRFYRIHFEVWRATRLLAIAGLVYWGVTMIDISAPIVAVLVKSVAITITYPLLLLAVGFFRRDEIAKVRSVVRNRLGRNPE